MLKSQLLLCLSIALISAFGHALEVGPLFTDHMMLQRQRDIPIWGTAAPGERVEVTLARRAAKTVADAEGRWKVVLPKMRAGGPHVLGIQGAQGRLEFKDVLIGEVWLCSGQSNMELPLSEVNQGTEEVAAAAYPNLRLFTVVKAVSEKPESECVGAWTPCTPAVASQFSAVGYFFAREIQKRLGDVPVGLIDSTWGGTPIEVWMSHTALASQPEFAGALGTFKAMSEKPVDVELEQKVTDWTRAAETAVLAGQFEGWYPGQPFSGGRRDPLMPTGLYNAMIHPLAPYAMRGVLWYQGEANTGSGVAYRKLFPAMIADWRSLWGGEAFPFLYVQLASFATDPQYPQMKTGWPLIQEAQLMTLAVENTAMAVAVDIGDAKDIHPRNKQEVGRRLGLAALAKVYHRKGPYSGPIFKSMKVQGKTAVLSFEHADKGLRAKDGLLEGYFIAGADGKFVSAQARIHRNKVHVWAEEVAAPVAVRYAWDDNPKATLFNGAGLPAAPFRTDTESGLADH